MNVAGSRVLVVDDVAENRDLLLRRLNRLEYANAVRDLLAVDVDEQALLPIDELKFGFDNREPVTTTCSVLISSWANAAS